MNVRSERRPGVTSKIMSAVKSKGSKAERALGRAMWALGIRYRKHARTVFGTPDFALIGLRVAVFCDGDFWHGRGWEKRGFASWEQQFERLKSPDIWRRKIAANMNRDRQVNLHLTQEGWSVLRFLESEVHEDVDRCTARVLRCVEAKRSSCTPVAK